MSKATSHTEREQHTVRLMASIVASMVLLIGAVRWWPLPSDDEPDRRIYSTRGQEVIEMEEILPTRQRHQAPPPPAPLPPIVVEDDVILDEFELDISDSVTPTEAPGIDAQETPGEDTGAPTSLASVSVGPRVVRIVEPQYTREARRRGVRAEAEIEVLVNARGQVEEARILERFLLKGDDEREETTEIGYGVEEAMLEAAGRWLFRPARENGKAVTSYTVVTLGVGRQ